MKLTMIRAICGFLLLALLLGACGGDAKTPTATTDLSLAPQSGAMALSSATPPALATTLTATPVPVVVWEIGQQVVASATTTLQLRADAGLQMPVMEEYPAGQKFTVVEPSGRYATGYPVQKDGDAWYRVRAEDGLVGWVQATRIEPVQ